MERQAAVRSIRYWYLNSPVWLGVFILHELWLLFGTMIPFNHPTPAILRTTELFSSKALLWFQYDSLIYLHIAHHGYAPYSLAFYPLLPIIIALAMNKWIALLIMQAVFAGDLYFLNRYFRLLQLSSNQVTLALIFFAFNPAAIFYSVLYTEPLTVLLIAMSLVYALESKYVIASISAGLAVLSHPTGALVGIMLLTLLFQSLFRRDWPKVRGAILWGSGVAIMIILYSLYSAVHWHSFLAPWQGEASWHSRWVWPWSQYTLIFAPLVPVETRVAEMLFAVLSIPYIVGTVLLTKLLSSHKNVPAIIFTWIGVVVSLSFLAMNWPFHSTLRLMSVYFPVYAGLALIKNRRIMTITVILWIAASLYGTILFTHQWWWQ